MSLTHRHRPAQTVDVRGFEGCVARAGQENKKAHGGRTATEVCRCGWVRDINMLGNQTEWGPWKAPQPTTRGA